MDSPYLPGGGQSFRMYGWTMPVSGEEVTSIKEAIMTRNA